MKLFKKILTTICAIAFMVTSTMAFEGELAQAATKQAQSSLYFNPSQPPSHWLMSTDKTFVASSTSAVAYLSSVTNGTSVGLKVKDYSKEHIYSDTGHFKVYNLPKGFVYHFTSRLVNYRKKITTAKTHVMA